MLDVPICDIWLHYINLSWGLPVKLIEHLGETLSIITLIAIVHFTAYKSYLFM